MNPFKFGQVVKGDDYCRRPETEENLLNEISRGQNIYLQGERRIGKTSLVIETVGQLNRTKLIYVDLLETKTIEGLIKRVVAALISRKQKSRFFESLMQKFSNLRPVISVDPITNMPTFSIDSSTSASPDSVSSVLDLVSSLDRPKEKLIIVFDEFQDIMNIKESKETLALLRSKIQFQTGISYIFIGSIRNEMDSIFNDSDSPFFKSALPHPIGALNRTTFREFIQKKFETDQRSISEQLLNQVFELCFDVPGDIQQLCGALWDASSAGVKLTSDYLLKALERIYTNELKGYEFLLKIMTGQQLKLISAMARIGSNAPLSSDFLKASGISQASSVQAGLKRLEKLNILFQQDKTYRFVNPFFRTWIISKNL